MCKFIEKCKSHYILGVEISRSRKHLYHPLHIDLFICVVKKTENVLFKLLSIHQKPNGNSST